MNPIMTTRPDGFFLGMMVNVCREIIPLAGRKAKDCTGAVARIIATHLFRRFFSNCENSRDEPWKNHGDVQLDHHSFPRIGRKICRTALYHPIILYLEVYKNKGFHGHFPVNQLDCWTFHWTSKVRTRLQPALVTAAWPLIQKSWALGYCHSWSSTIATSFGVWTIINWVWLKISGTPSPMF